MLGEGTVQWWAGVGERNGATDDVLGGWGLPQAGPRQWLRREG